MCRVLKISRSTYYYEAKQKPDESKLVALIKDIFTKSRSNYGTRKIRNELRKLGRKVSRRRIGRIMKQEGLVSKYTVAQFKPYVPKCNEEKISNLVKAAFASANVNLSKISIFHTDRGNEFKNQAIDEMLDTFLISRLLSKKGCPYDNAVAEATFKIIKTEFVKNECFETLEELQFKLADYVNWFNKFRIHSSLDYLTPIQFRENHLKKVV